MSSRVSGDASNASLVSSRASSKRNTSWLVTMLLYCPPVVPVALCYATARVREYRRLSSRAVWENSITRDEKKTSVLLAVWERMNIHFSLSHQHTLARPSSPVQDAGQVRDKRRKKEKSLVCYIYTLCEIRNERKELKIDCCEFWHQINLTLSSPLLFSPLSVSLRPFSGPFRERKKCTRVQRQKETHTEKERVR